MMAAAANLATQVGKYGQVKLHVKNAVGDSRAFYVKHGAEFEEGSQQGRWRDQRKIYDLAVKAQFSAAPPTPVMTAEEERSNYLDAFTRRMRRMMKRDRSNGGTGLFNHEYELDPAGIGSLASTLPELSRDQLIAELKARRIPVRI